ncbi:hypothetical protein LTR91_027153, partial [Friedmanniomyces endolithicus]
LVVDELEVAEEGAAGADEGEGGGGRGPFLPEEDDGFPQDHLELGVGGVRPGAEDVAVEDEVDEPRLAGGDVGVGLWLDGGGEVVRVADLEPDADRVRPRVGHVEGEGEEVVVDVGRVGGVEE